MEYLNYESLKKGLLQLYNIHIYTLFAELFNYSIHFYLVPCKSITCTRIYMFINLKNPEYAVLLS